MIEKIIKYKKYIISITLIFLLSLFFLNMKYLLPKKYKEIPEVRLKEIKNSKTFAIKIQNGEEYEEYSSNKWPDENYQFKEAKCVNDNGALIDNAITFENGKATLKINQTIYCTLYFDKSTLGKLRESETLANKNNLSPEPNQGGMYRYQGTDDVSNWICFGTTDNCGTNDDLIDKYMYRIIGITKEGQLYLLKETFVKENGATRFGWNDKYSIDSSDPYYCDNGICPDWPQTQLFKRINGNSNGIIPGKGIFLEPADTDIFVDSSEYDYLKSGDSINGTKDEKGSRWYQLIANHEWMYGDTIEYNIYNGEKLYNIETGNLDTIHYIGTKDNLIEKSYNWTQKEPAKISLMYMHDVAYAYYDGIDSNTRGNPGNETNVSQSWIFFQKDGYNLSPTTEWLSTKFGPHGYKEDLDLVGARSVGPEGGLGHYYGYGQFNPGVRPVFYLNSNVKLKSGNGTKANPFIINL